MLLFPAYIISKYNHIKHGVLMIPRRTFPRGSIPRCSVPRRTFQRRRHLARSARGAAAAFGSSLLCLQRRYCQGTITVIEYITGVSYNQAKQH